MNDLEISKKYAKIIVSKRFGNNFNINNKDLDQLESGIYELFLYIPSYEWVYQYSHLKENIITLLSQDINYIKSLFCEYPPWFEIQSALNKMDYKAKFIKNYF